MGARRPGKRRRKGGRSGCLAIAALVALVAGGYAAWKALTWPDVARLSGANPKTTAFIEMYRADRRAEGKSDRVAWTWVPYAAISPALKRAVLVGEDIGFFSHHGFEVAEMKKALREAVEDKELPRGASTITQQLAKNLWLSPSRNPLRKVEEAVLTWQIERRLGKRRILELYLNIVELGPGVYGAEAGARRWFGKSAADLTDEEAAQLAASLPNPEDWHPGSASAAYRRHVQRILRRMEKASWIGNEL
jgi:monofunctional glycosyltransferase